MAESGRGRWMRKIPQEYILLGMGIVIGILIMVIFFFVLLGLGMINTGAPQPTAEIIPTPDLARLCPACEPHPTQVICPPTATPTATATNTPTNTPTPTPDIPATATAACEAFENQFPGTPCPSSSQ